MARAAGGEKKSSWMMWAFWAAGVSLLLAEMKAGMGYVEAGLQQNLSGLLGDLPAMGMITLNVAEHSMWHWSAVKMAFEALPIIATGFLLVVVGFVWNRQLENSR